MINKRIVYCKYTINEYNYHDCPSSSTPSASESCLTLLLSTFSHSYCSLRAYLHKSVHFLHEHRFGKHLLLLQLHRSNSTTATNAGSSLVTRGDNPTAFSIDDGGDSTLLDWDLQFCLLLEQGESTQNQPRNTLPEYLASEWCLLDHP